MRQFNVFYVLKHLYLEAPIQIDDGALLIPLEGMSCEDELEIADQLIAVKTQLGWHRGILTSPEEWSAQREQLSAECRDSVKLSVLVIPGVEAHSREGARELTEMYAKDLSQILSLVRNVTITIPLWEIDDVTDPELKRAAFSFTRRGSDITYQNGESRQRLLEEILRGIPFSNLLEQQPALRMALRWYLEAYQERNPDTKLLKFWIALESLAEHASEDGGPSFDKEHLRKVGNQLIELGTASGWEQRTLKNRVNGALSQLNRASIKEKIRELLLNEKMGIERISRTKDVIDVLYEARNLIVHYGGIETLPEAIRRTIKNLDKRLGGQDLGKLRLKLRNLLWPILGRRLRIEIILR